MELFGTLRSSATSPLGNVHHAWASLKSHTNELVYVFSLYVDVKRLIPSGDIDNQRMLQSDCLKL